MGVPREVVQDVGGTAKRRVRVDEQGLSKEGSENPPKGGRGGKWLEHARKVQPALVKGVAEASHEFRTKNLPKDLPGQKESLSRVDPLCVRRQAAGRHHAMDVRMMLQALAPRVEDHQPADGGAEPLGAGGGLEERE